MQATLNAISEVYSSASLHLSEVHWKRNLRERISEISGLLQLQEYVRTIWSVALVPVEDISWYWAHIVLPAKPQIELEDSDNNEDARKAISQAVEKLLEYVERNFIGRRDGEGRYERPLFSPEMWSKYNSALQCHTLNTNKAEVADLFIIYLYLFYLFTPGFQQTHRTESEKGYKLVDSSPGQTGPLEVRDEVRDS